MTVAEVLKAAGVTDEVAAGLPKEVVAALGGYVSSADTKLSTAAQEAQKAEEARRQAELERKEVTEYVNKYETSLNEQGSLKAKYDAAVAYLESLKTQGFDVKIPGAEGAGNGAGNGDGKKPIVPGSPAMGGNAVDEGKILGRVGNVMSQWLDANNEHIRLYGVPIPDPSTTIAEEAARARKSVGEFIAEKYKFSERQTAKAKEAYDARVAADVAAKVAERDRLDAEKRGSNPNLRGGESSRSSFVPKIKGEEFHKSDGNVPKRERERRLLDNLHKEVEQIRSVA
jgi:hypothetical protein